MLVHYFVKTISLHLAVRKVMLSGGSGPWLDVVDVLFRCIKSLLMGEVSGLVDRSG